MTIPNTSSPLVELKPAAFTTGSCVVVVGTGSESSHHRRFEIRTGGESTNNHYHRVRIQTDGDDHFYHLLFVIRTGSDERTANQIPIFQIENLSMHIKKL